jgi:hypothetical protein
MCVCFLLPFERVLVSLRSGPYLDGLVERRQGRCFGRVCVPRRSREEDDDPQPLDLAPAAAIGLKRTTSDW